MDNVRGYSLHELVIVVSCYPAFGYLVYKRYHNSLRGMTYQYNYHPDGMGSLARRRGLNSEFTEFVK